MRAVTNLGNGWVVYWLVLLYVYYYNRQKFKESFFLLFLTQIVPGIIDIIVKKAVHRPRPAVALHSLIQAGKVHVNILGRHLTTDSFPSGHTVTAFSLAVALSYMFPKHKKTFYIIAFVVGFSRVYDGEHYPLDVIAGGIIGYFFAKITLLLYKKIKNYKNYNFE
ncbi:MAG: phosphatase PAP2 family protein [Candidatus Acidulodesulfobacterium sp.]